jgi:hypothetical protein
MIQVIACVIHALKAKAGSNTDSLDVDLDWLTTLGTTKFIERFLDLLNFKDDSAMRRLLPWDR